MVNQFRNYMFGIEADVFVKRKPTEDERKIYSLFSTKEGQEFLSWLRKRTIEKQIPLGVQDGIQTSILTARELGRCDIYHELNKILIKVSLYDDGK